MAELKLRLTLVYAGNSGDIILVVIDTLVCVFNSLDRKFEDALIFHKV